MPTRISTDDVDESLYGSDAAAPPTISASATSRATTPAHTYVVKGRRGWMRTVAMAATVDLAACARG
ncbi:hypothetical protein CCO02nite_20260 [Cellulomonas composti]|uniref:Uncharacterized protein n=1 Tax=Cellulomonas composti TaxID=266130 RepID=A0A511JBL3_9CELL|nr:hypothetical protein CCO02nite_20260 [Cellulomonas composti]